MFSWVLATFPLYIWHSDIRATSVYLRVWVTVVGRTAADAEQPRCTGAAAPIL